MSARDKTSRITRVFADNRIDEAGIRVLWLIGALVVTAFAYHRLASLAGPADRPEGPEAYVFAVDTTSPGMVVALTIFLIYRRLDRVTAAMRTPPSARATMGGVAATSLAAILCVWGHYVDAPAILVPSLTLMLLGGALILGGRAGADAMLAPSLFLLLAFPIPPPLLNLLIYPMQLMTASNTAGLLRIAGFDAFAIGEFVHRGGYTFYVIESCAGLRSTASLLIAATFYNELLDRRRGRALLVMLIALPIGLIVNQLRVLWIALYPTADISDDHLYQGIVMLVVGVVLLSLTDEVLDRFRTTRPHPGPKTRPAPSTEEAASTSAGRAVSLSLLLLALGFTTATLPTWSPEPVWRTPISSLSPTLDGEWRTTGRRLDREFLGSTHYSEWTHRTYTKRDIEIDVLVGASDRLATRDSLISVKNEIPGPGHRTIRQRTIELPESTTAVQLRRLQHLERRVLSLQWYVGVDDVWTETIRAMFALDRGPWRRPGRAISARMSIELSANPARWAEQEAELMRAASFVMRELSRIEAS